MSNNNKTLTTTIKQTLRNTDYRIMVLGSFLIALVTLIQSFLMHPDVVGNGTLDQHFGFTITMTSVVFVLLLGMVVVLAATRYYEPNIIRFFNIRKTIDELKGMMITFGAFLAKKDDETEKVMSFIKSKIAGLENQISTLKEQIAKLMPLVEENVDLKKENVDLKKENAKLKKIKDIVDDKSDLDIRNKKKLDKFQKTFDDFQL